MITGGQKYWIILDRLSLDAAHGLTHDILFRQHLRIEGDQKLAEFSRKHQSILSLCSHRR